MRSARHRAAMSTALAIVVTTALTLASAAGGSADTAPPPAARVETLKSTADPVGDSGRPQSDLVAASTHADADGTTTVQVTVDEFENPMSTNWKFGLTGVSWDFDVNGDQALDFDLTLYTLDNAVQAKIIDETSVPVCDAVPSWNEAARTYSATFQTSCLGDPASFSFRALMAYEDADTAVQTTDQAPDTGWLGPVVNDARCTPGTVGPAGPAADGFVSLLPARLLDTRTGMPTIDCTFNGIGRVGGTTEVQLTVAGRGGVPANATAVVLNLTATDGLADGFVTVYPCGTERPEASNVNYLAHTTVPNAVFASIGTGGAVCLFSNAAVHLVADVNGYYTGAASFVPQRPARQYDSRKSGTIRPAGSSTPIGPFNASSVVLNVTITQPQSDGFATVYPCGAERPLASNLNFTAGVTSSNAVIAKVGADGNVCVFTSATAHLVVDVNGSYPNGAGYTSLVPARLLETRSGASTFDGVANGVGLLNGPAVLTLKVTDRGGVPPNASAVVLNVTVADARTAGFITVFPCGSPQPLASSLNYVQGSILANAVVSQVGAGGNVCFYSNAPTHLIVDVNGFYPVT